MADETWVRLERWEGSWGPHDPFADLKADVATYGHADPVRTLRRLSEDSGIPLGALVRYVLARWAAGGAEALLELGTSGVAHLRRTVDEAERAGTDAARLAAYDAVRQQVAWLAHGLDDPAAAHPAGGAGPPRRVRVGSYAVVRDRARRLLLTRLAPGREAAGRWTLPGGGLEHGEDPRDGLRREVHEETGQRAEPGALLEVASRRDPPELAPAHADVHAVRLLFAAEVAEPTAPRVVEIGGSTDAARWVPADELGDLPLVDVAVLGARLAGLLRT